MEKLVIVTVCMKPGYVYIVPLSCNHLYIYISPGGVFVRGLRSQPNPKGSKSGKRLEPISRKRHLIQSPTYTRSATHTCSHSYDDHTLSFHHFEWLIRIRSARASALLWSTLLIDDDTRAAEPRCVGAL